MMKKILSFFLIIAALMTILSPSLLADGFDHTDISSKEEWDLLDNINEYRIKNGLIPLGMFAPLQDAAHTRSAELLSSLSHYRGDGSPWYTALSANGLDYNNDCFEAIAANFDSADDVVEAWAASDVNWERILSDKVGHIGAGYSSSAQSKNKNAWELIGLNCDGINSIKIHTDGDIHVPAGSTPAGKGMFIEAVCPHGSSYLSVYTSMIKGFEPYKIGKQKITVNYAGKSAGVEVICDYKDVKATSWFYEPVMNCTEKGYFSGVSNTSFAPNNEMTRAMFVTVLGRFAGVDASKYSGSSFSDVKTSQWYAPYVEWAAQNGIVSGTGNGKFSPNKGITRQEICSIITRYVDKYSIDLPQIMSKKEFTDSAKIASWARDAVTYCQTRGIISGDNKGAFNPRNTATRAEVAVIVTNMNKIIK